MVAGVAADLYSTYRHPVNPDEGAQSGEDSSGFQSPTPFGTSFSPPHDDSFRYQHNQLGVQRAGAIIAPHYDYTSPLDVQQVPLLDTPLAPNSGAQSVVTYPHYYTVDLSPRNHLTHNFSIQPLSHSGPFTIPGDDPIDLRYTSPTERRLPGGPSHDQSYSRQAKPPSGNPAYTEQRPPMPSPPPEPREPSMNGTVASGTRTRKEISSVVIACRQCRGRKIRCDSTRPVCSNCVRRNNPCEYDPAPKRRGPDKNPGTRHRRCKRRPPDDSAPPPPPKRKRTAIDRSLSSSYAHDVSSSLIPQSISKVKENMANENRSPPSVRSLDARPQQERPPSHQQLDSGSPIELKVTMEGLTSPVTHDQSPTSRRHHHPVPYASEQSSYIKSSFPRPLDVNIMRSPSHSQLPKMPASPTSTRLRQAQKLWWTSFLTSVSLAEIEQEIRYLFTDTGHWLSFLNLDHFVKTLMDEDARLNIQPAFIFAGLAMSTLMKSSELEFKAPGRERALWFRATAQTHLDNSLASNWLDPSLAEAALIIALFETSAHPRYSPDRVEQALLTVDHIVRITSLSTIDASDPDVVRYPAGCVPMMPLDDNASQAGGGGVHSAGVDPTAAGSSGSLSTLSPRGGGRRECTCIPPGAPTSPDPFTSWSYRISWDPTWTDNEIRNEECRRLCWSALSLMCNYVSQCVAFDRDPPGFFLMNAENYAILFPGEILDRVSPAFRGSTSPSTKEAVWALYCRSMLLWSFTNRIRTSDTLPNDDKVDLVYDASSEAEDLHDALAMHTCNLDTMLMYLCREYIHNTQIMVTQTLRSLQGLGNGPPIFKRRQAQDWIDYQGRVLRIVRSNLVHAGGTESHEWTRRPYQAIWFANQLSICMVLWNFDRELKGALELAKSILMPVEMMMSLWPCPALQRQAEDLRRRLIEACHAEGIEPPMPANYTMPAL